MKYNLVLTATVLMSLVAFTAEAHVENVKREETRTGEWHFKRMGEGYHMDQNLTHAKGTYTFVVSSVGIEDQIPFEKTNYPVPTTGKGKAVFHLVQDNNKVFLSYDLALPDHSDEIFFSANDKVEVTFVEGNWEDYVSNRKVTLEVTEDGKKVYLAKRRKFVQPGIDHTVGELNGIFPDTVKLGDVGVTQIGFATAKAGIFVSATQDEMTIRVTPVISTIETSLSVADTDQGKEEIKQHHQTILAKAKKVVPLIEMLEIKE